MDEYDMGHTRKIVETVNVYSRDDISAYKEEEQRIIRNLRSALEVLDARHITNIGARVSLDGTGKNWKVIQVWRA